MFYLCRYLRELECFKAVDKSKYIVWTDTGSHFRNSEFMHYLFKELFEQKISVSFNLFCEKQGKNSRDQHFSVVSNFIFKESMVKRLTSSQDICDAIMKQQAIANKNNLRLNNLRKMNSTSILRKLEITKAFVIPYHKKTINTNSKLTIVGLKKYYNFFISNSFLYTHFMSDQLNFERLYPTITSSFSEIQTTMKPDKISPTVVDNNYLNIKMSNCRLSEISSKSLLTQIQIIQELSKHSHPKSRMSAQRKNRTFAEAKAELHFHYLKNHTNSLLLL